jgi:hypothetical protein
MLSDPWHRQSSSLIFLFSTVARGCQVDLADWSNEVRLKIHPNGRNRERGKRKVSTAARSCACTEMSCCGFDLTVINNVAPTPADFRRLHPKSSSSATSRESAD